MPLENDQTTQVETQNDIDPFEAAFKELSELEAQGKENEFNPAKEPVRATEQKTNDTEKSVETPASGTTEIQDGEVHSSDGTGKQAEVSTEATSETDDEIEEKSDPTETLLNKFSEIIDRSNKQVDKKEPDQKPVQQQETPAEIYTTDEKEFLQTYAKDWQDVVKGEALVRKQEYHHLLNYVFKEVSEQLKPMLETLGTLSERTHLSDLKSEVSDYSDIRDKVIEWADKQPPYLRNAYDHVIKQGTVEEVKDLIERYRKDIGGVVATPKVQAKSTAKTELSEATKQAAATLAPVSSKRSTVTVSTPDANDFDSAFEMFSKLE